MVWSVSPAGAGNLGIGERCDNRSVCGRIGRRNAREIALHLFEDKMEPLTTVFKNSKTGIFYVQPYTIGPVAATWFGNPSIVRPEEFSTNIVDAIITNLEKFGKEKFDPAKAIRFSAKEQKRFLDEHTEVSVSKLDSGGLIIHPLRRDGGGRVGDQEGTIVLSEEDIPTKLAGAIAEAFKRAT
jgi:hypothetical protein